ncbi:MAG: sensor histidine kinase, partial [Deltaproteobacteria bacterium]
MDDWLDQDREAFQAAQARRDADGLRLWAVAALVQAGAALATSTAAAPPGARLPYALPMVAATAAVAAAIVARRSPDFARARVSWVAPGLVIFSAAAMAAVLSLSPAALALATGGILLGSMAAGLLFGWPWPVATAVQGVVVGLWFVAVSLGPGWLGDPAQLVADAGVLIGGAVLATVGQHRLRRHQAERFHQLCELERSTAVVDSERHRVRQSGREKDQLFSDVTNGLREPVVRILRRLDQQMQESPERRAALQPLWRDGLRLLRKLDDLGTLALLQRGYLRLRAQRVDLRATVEQIVAPVQERAARIGLGVELSFDDVPADVHLDPMRFERIILAMLTEALRRSNDDIQVEVSVDRHATGAELVRIEVWCEGEGDEEKRGSDDEFWREPEGERVEVRLARALAVLHGGRLEEPTGDGAVLSWVLLLRAGTEHLFDEVIDRRVRDRAGGRG